jgi:hypothetical protein
VAGSRAWQEAGRGRKPAGAASAKEEGAGITGPFVTIGTSGINHIIIADVKIDTTIRMRRIR